MAATFDGELTRERQANSGCIYNLTFRNEYDRQIELQVESGPAPDNGPTLITISMSGPTSLSTNTITLAEARRLRDALNKTIR